MSLKSSGKHKNKYIRDFGGSLGKQNEDCFFHQLQQSQQQHFAIVPPFLNNTNPVV